MSKLICLASGSPSRKKVFEGANLNFKIQKPDTEEIYQGESVKEYVMRLAEEKAAVIDDKEADVIVSADSVFEYDGKIIEKPSDLEDAFNTLKVLQGTTHQFHTGMCVIDTKTNNKKLTYTITSITLDKLNDEEIKFFVEKYRPFSFAGGYALGIADWFISTIDGPHTNLMGMPLQVLKETIEELDHRFIEFIK